jgi:hypothetical protein
MNLCNIPPRIRAKPAVSNPNLLIRIRPGAFGYAQPAQDPLAVTVAWAFICFIISFICFFIS